MLKILVVEDDNVKCSQIIETLCSIPEIRSDYIDSNSDIIGAKKNIEEKQYDLMILDIQLPIRFGDEPKPEGGVDFLQELSVSATQRKPFHIIGLTSYPDLQKKYTSLFENEVWVLIQYESTQVDWKIKLQNKLNYLIKSKSDMLNYTNVEYQFDIAIVTALRNPELRAVLDLKANWEETKFENDRSTTYYKGIFQNQTKRLSVVAASCPQMGMNAASVLSTKMIQRFRPKYLVMLGISAGIRGKGNFGDVLVIDYSWDYGSGKNKYNEKSKETMFEPDPRPITLDPDISDMINSAIAEKKYVSDISNNWRGFDIETPLKAVIGPVASGAAVLENIHLIEEHIKVQQRKVVGIEMEAYGVFTASKYSSEPKPKCIVIKSVCDFGDSEKSDKFQTYSAYTSAEYFYRFALEYL